ncbi:MAG: cytochrome c3 family protein [Rhodothermales bacterium]|nr:cytochrome c3 family protein [Rhodothermales bacterium]
MLNLSSSPARLALLIVALAACLTPTASQSQLISPGKLTRAHTDLEGVANCTQCHALGQRSANDDLCLNCHTPIEARINAKTGFHVTVDAQPCGDCHKEHFGVDFVPVRFDTTAFEHDKTTFKLTGAHQETACRTCHQTDYILAPDVLAYNQKHNALDKTYLGLLTPCKSCHEPDSPHQDQFETEACDTCHETEKWEEAVAFDHDEARFKLTGRHQDVSCENCHETRQTPAGAEYALYRPIEFASCRNCHEDQHEGRFGADCVSCHKTADWHELTELSKTKFDHDETGYELIGSHADLECASCHQKPARRDADIRVTLIGNTAGNTYPRLQATNCLSCHVDFHQKEFVESPGGGAVCENCHDQHDFYPSTYDITRHLKESSFELTGAHLATACVACHNPDGDRPTFAIEETECQDCHREDSPHGDQFADERGLTACTSCHVTERWDDARSFDHDETLFALTGKHETVACDGCHKAAGPEAGFEGPAYRGLDTACASCHTEDDPHLDQFPGKACNDCHDTQAFEIPSFDHEKTRFSLTGAHTRVACESCHTEEQPSQGDPFTRYRPLPTACEDCHGEE